MKVLIINTYYYNRGGDTTYAFSLAELLRSQGHEVRFLSMKHPKNISSPDEKYFLDYIDFVEAVNNASFSTGVKVLSRSIYSFHAKKKLNELIKDFRPDIAHIQNIHAHITPSVLIVLKKHSIPVFWTLHDYKLICPNTDLLLHGKICEKCKGNNFFQCILQKCKKDSYVASIVAAIEAEVHHLMNIPDLVNRFISPSLFLGNKFIEFGWQAKKLNFVRNFLTDDYFEEVENEDDDYILYVGRLESTKGLETLLFSLSKSASLPLKIVGDGTRKNFLESLKEKLALNRVEFLGNLERKKVKQLIARSSFIVIPSEWYENCPYSIMETQAVGKPVIGSQVGGIPELVQHGINGLIFEPGNAEDLSIQIEILSANKSLRENFGKAAKIFAEENYRASLHYEAINNLYNGAKN